MKASVAGVSLGQYYPSGSVLHALDPRAKVVGVTLLASGLFLVGTLWGMLAAAAVAGALVFVSRIPPDVFLRLLRPVAFVVAFTAIFQVFFAREGALLVGWGPFQVYTGGLEAAAFLCGRILLLVTVAGLLTATTAPVELADGIEDLLSPLRRLRFPAHEVAMMATISLRFIPTLHEEAKKISDAQAARGAAFSEGGPVKRARALLPVLVPLTVGAFRRADELADAMESRGYRGGEGRTRYRALTFRVRDAGAVLVALLLVLCALPA